MRLARHSYAPEHTAGHLHVGEHVLHTVERPWVPGLPGGMPGVSCVPDGRYSLQRHARPNGDVVCALRNPDHGVYYSAQHVPAAGGRSLILIHAANFVEELLGCIAPGMGRAIHDNRLMVTASRQAMALVMAAFDAGDNELEIVPALGTG